MKLMLVKGSTEKVTLGKNSVQLDLRRTLRGEDDEEKKLSQEQWTGSYLS